jgi:suppressor for copper-sensitivity B
VVCVPQHVDLSLAIASGAPAATAYLHDISRFLANVPGDGARQGLSLVSAQGSPDGSLTVVVAADPPLKAPDLFLERADQLQFSKPNVSLEQGGKRATFHVKAISGTGEGGLNDKPLVLTVVDGERGMEVATAVAAHASSQSLSVLFAMLGAALFGGLILNLMPCVLPVLSLKILALISHGGAEKREVQSSFLATAAGIIVSFLVLAGATAGLKLAGAAVGWGIQFQQPLFLCVMIALVTLFAANMFGLFEIPLPRFIADLGGGNGPSHGFMGHFATGAFATLLATPCTAPFLGTAVGFALAHGTIEIFAIFAMLGVGMSLPYLLVAVWPRLAQSLPRPGAWMIKARAFLGVLLLATGGWLLSVLAVVLGLGITLAMAGVMALSMLFFVIAHRRGWERSAIAVTATLAAAIGISTINPGLAADDHKSAVKGAWRPFDQTAIAAEVAAGHVVFVDVTAEWCLTCQVNKAAVV